MIHRLAWQQLRQERLRLLAAVAGITFAVVLQLQQFGFREALFTSATVLHDRLRADLVMISSQYEFIVAPSVFPRRRLYEVQRRGEVESVAPFFLALAPFKDPDTREDHAVLLIGFNPDDEVFEPGSIPGDFGRLHVADTALLDARSRQQYQPLVQRVRREGTVSTEMVGRRIEIPGLFELGASFTGNAHMMTSDTTFRRLLAQSEGEIQIGLIRLTPGTDAEQTRAALAAVLAPDVMVLTRQQFADLELRYWNSVSPIGFIFTMGLFVGLLVGAVIVYQILYTDVTDPLPEYATLKAMGYRDRALAMVVMQEAVILSVLGFPVGFLISNGLYIAARQATGLPLFMTLPRLAGVFGLTVFMCVAAGLLAMRKLKSADPADAF